MNRFHLFLVALGILLLAACQKELEDTAPSNQQEWVSSGSDIQITNVHTVAPPSGTPVVSNFPEIALADFRKSKGDSLTGGGDEFAIFQQRNPPMLAQVRDSLAVTPRGWVNGFNFRDVKAFPIAKAFEVAVITSDSTGDDYQAFAATVVAWQSTYTGKIFVSMLKDSLHVATMEVFAYPEAGATPDIIWFKTLDAFTNQPIPDGGLGYTFVNRSPAVAFKNEVGLPRRIEAVYFSHNSPEYFLWQLPNMYVTHYMALVFEWAGGGDAQGIQDMSGITCVQVNEAQVLMSDPQPADQRHINAAAPLGGTQDVILSPVAAPGLVPLPSHLVVGTESWPLPTMFGPATMQKFVLSVGTIWENHVPAYEDYNCFY